MGQGDGGAAVEVGNGARHPQHAVKGAGGEAQLDHGGLQKVMALGVEGTGAFQGLAAQALVKALLPAELALPRQQHPFPHHGGAFSRLALLQLAWRQRRHLDMQVDAVEQGAGQAAAVAADLFHGAAATTAGIAQVAAGAGVHGGDQLEAGGKGHLARGTGDDDMARLQWFAQNLQHLTIKFGHYLSR